MIEALLGSQSERDQHHSTVAVQIPPSEMTVLWEAQLYPQEPQALPAQAPATQMPAHLQKEIEQAVQEAMNIDCELPVEDRAVHAQHLAILLKGFPMNFTPCDWQGVKMINKRKREATSYSSSTQDQDHKDSEEEKQISPSQITVTTGTSPSDATPPTDQDNRIQLSTSWDLTLEPEPKRRQLVNLSKILRDGYFTLSDTDFKEFLILVLVTKSLSR